MYITNIDCCPLWAWGINSEDVKNNKLTLDRIELNFREEEDLLCDPEFLYGDFY